MKNECTQEVKIVHKSIHLRFIRLCAVFSSSISSDSKSNVAWTNSLNKISLTITVIFTGLRNNNNRLSTGINQRKLIDHA